MKIALALISIWMFFNAALQLWLMFGKHLSSSSDPEFRETSSPR